MPGYPRVEPHDRGMLAVGDGHELWWETCGSPEGTPAIVLHGGPGSGCRPWMRGLFDPDAYRIVLLDQRNAGRSTPHASEPDVDLSTNTTHHLVDDLERVREHLGVDRWVVVGGSWGSILGLAYAERHPDRVRALVLFGVATGTRAEDDWLFRGGLSTFFPQAWDRLVRSLPEAERGGDVVEAYAKLLFDPDAEVRRDVAEAWCRWESATPAWPPTDELDDRFLDLAFALGFARIVTHYVRHDAWLEDGELLRGAAGLAGIPGVLVKGRWDVQSPIGYTWALQRAWPGSDLVVVDDAGHDASNDGIIEAIVDATDRFRDA
jgi:proline iminopeptidase